MSIESSGVLVSDEGPIAHAFSDEGPIAHAVSGHAPLDRKPTDFGARSAPAPPVKKRHGWGVRVVDEVDYEGISATACFEGHCCGEALEIESMPSMCGGMREVELDDGTGGVREIELDSEPHTKSKKTVEL